MRLIIEARLEIDQGSSTTTAEAATIVVVVEHQDRSVAGLGLTHAEGRALLAEAQSVLVSHQAAGSTADLQGLFVATERALADLGPLSGLELVCYLYCSSIVDIAQWLQRVDCRCGHIEVRDERLVTGNELNNP